MVLTKTHVVEHWELTDHGLFYHDPHRKGKLKTHVARRTPNGWVVCNDSIKGHLQLNANTLFRGKVLQKRTLDEVREFDGRDGRPMWAYVGRDVFDFSSKFIVHCLGYFTSHFITSPTS